MSDFVREASRKHRNWGKWGQDDERGTLNYVTPEMIVRAVRLVKRGVVFSLAIPFDSSGPAAVVSEALRRVGGRRGKMAA